MLVSHNNEAHKEVMTDRRHSLKRGDRLSKKDRQTNLNLLLDFSVDPKLWSQVVEIYPCLVDCITCSSDAVRDALKQTLFEFKDLLLHKPNSKMAEMNHQ